MRVSHNPLHPDMLRLETASNNAVTLDAALAAHPNYGLTCTINERDRAMGKLLLARAFIPVRRIVEGGWQGDPSATLPQLDHGTLAQRSDLTGPWLAAHRQHYFATHRVNPPAEMDTQSWNEVFLTEDFQPAAAFYILDENGIAAFSSLRKGIAGWELAWFGTVPENHHAFEALNEGLIALETAYMASLRIPEVQCEFDSTNPDAMWRAHRVGLSRIKTYQTYHLKR